MFCGFQLSNLSVPENIEDIKQKWNKRVLTYCITMSQFLLHPVAMWKTSMEVTTNER